MKKLFQKGFPASDREKEQFVELTKRLIDIMVEFSLLTLRTISKKKQAFLTKSQIADTINFDLQFRIQQIQDPELLDIVRDRVLSEFLEDQKTYFDS